MSEAVATSVIGAIALILVGIITWSAGRRSSKAQEITAITEGATKVAGKFESYSDKLEARVDKLSNEMSCIRESNNRLESRTSALETMFDLAVGYIRTLVTLWPHTHVALPPAREELRDLIITPSEKER